LYFKRQFSFNKILKLCLRVFVNKICNLITWLEEHEALRTFDGEAKLQGTTNDYIIISSLKIIKHKLMSRVSN